MWRYPVADWFFLFQFDVAFDLVLGEDAANEIAAHFRQF